MTDVGYNRLVATIISYTVNDYIRALRMLRKNMNNVNALREKEECERFFLGDMCCYSDLDGKTIIRRCEEKVNLENRKRGGRK